jgi:hypothetical protein
MECRVYNPTITRSVLLNTWDNPQGLHYAGEPTIAFWRGRYYATFVAGPGYVENANFAHVWMMESTDGVTWSAPYRPFRDSAYCANPFADYGTTGADRDAQPCLTVVGDELWCHWWSFGFTDRYVQTSFFSRLTAPGAKWTTRRFEFSGVTVSLSTTISNYGAPATGRNICPEFDTRTDWSPSICGPALIHSATGDTLWPYAFTAVPSATDYSDMLKRVGIMRSNPNGTSWSLLPLDCSSFANSAGRTTSPWEPFLIENPVGYLTCFVRRLNLVAENVADVDAMGFTTSYDGGVSFPPVKSTKLIVCDARGFADRIGPGRWLMTHCDYPGRVARSNGSLYLSRRGGNDFVAGIGFTGTDPYVSYPQFCVGPDGKARIVYGSGYNLFRKMIRMATVDMPNDNAMISPRSQTLTYTSAATDPVLDATGTPPAWAFNGHQKLKGTTPCAASTAATYAAWVRMDFTGAVEIDARNGNAGGGVINSSGCNVDGLNFAHGYAPARQDYFHAAVIDNATQTVTQYLGDGDSTFRTKVSYYKSLLFTANPVDGDTVIIGGTTYTFRVAPSADNDVLISSTPGGTYASQTIFNLQPKLTARSIQNSWIQGDHLVLALGSGSNPLSVTSGSTAITVESAGIPLGGGGVMNVGHKYSSASSLIGWDGKIYDARYYTSALSEANIRSLYNAKGGAFGYPAMSGATAPSTSPLVLADPANPNVAEFPPLSPTTDPPPSRCQVVSNNLLRIWGDGSASVELPWGVTRLTIAFTLGATPQSGDIYTVATFGTSDQPITLSVTGTDTGHIYCGTTAVGTVVSNSATITVDVYTSKIRIGTFERAFGGKPRAYLGQAYPAGKLASDKYIDYRVPAMSVRKVP